MLVSRRTHFSLRALPVARWQGHRRCRFCSCSANLPTNKTNEATTPTNPPRFFHPEIPQSQGSSVKLSGSEAVHMARALRLQPGHNAELFDGQGTVARVVVSAAERQAVTVELIEDARAVPRSGPQWTVAVACGGLKGGRADWLIEKCTELGAAAVLPLLSERSPAAAEGRVDRWGRVALAAAKQSQRLHCLVVHPPTALADVLPQIAASVPAPSFVGVAGAPPLLQQALKEDSRRGGFLLVGPEGDFSQREHQLMSSISNLYPVGLGALRLRVETAAVAMLAGAMLVHDMAENS